MCLFMLICLIDGAASAQAVNYVVPNPFFDMQQPNNNSCWATAATMLASWKAKSKLPISTVTGQAGVKYVQLFKNNKRLSSSDKVLFLSGLHLVAEPPATYTAQALESILRKWGPLWITTAEGPADDFSVHGRVVKGIMGDGSGDGTTLLIADPADGTTHPESLNSFTAKMATLARSDYGSGADVRPLIVHF